MKKIKTLALTLLIASALITSALAHSHPGEPEPPTPTVSNWAREELGRAQALGLIPQYDLPEDYTAPISRGDFRMLAMQFAAVQLNYDVGILKDLIYLYLSEKDEDGTLVNVFTDGSDDDALAYYIGLVQGRGDGIFDPDGLITRQEAAVMLTRSYGVCGGVMPEGEGPRFADKDEIADWATESVAALDSWEVMHGSGDGNFEPEGYYTVEQCIATFLRLYENTPVSRVKGNVEQLFTYQECLDYIDGLTKTESIGYRESLRLDGEIATCIRLDYEGVMIGHSNLYFVYKNGDGMRFVDVGICNHPYGFTPSGNLENPYFSDDGKTFYCTMTLNNDIYSVSDQERLMHAKGVYNISVDLETCEYEIN